MNEIIVKEVKFLDTDLLAIQATKTGKIYAAINFILRGLGFDEKQIEYQKGKWTNDKVISKGILKFSGTLVNAKTGKDISCILLNKLPLALAKINITPKMQKTMPELVEKFEIYQDKCADILADAFLCETGTYSANQQLQIPFPDIVQSIQIIANDLKVNDASKIIMYTTLYKDYNLPTNFLPKYEFNGNRDMKPATELLKRFNLKLSAKAFNNLMIANGYLEERTRNSRADITKVKKYKALTEKGLKYGENAVCVQCQKETQPLYYADTFEELFDIVSGRNEIVV